MTTNLFTVDHPWPHQLQGVSDVVAALGNGANSLCLTSPTGAGKTQQMIALTRWAVGNGKRVMLFTNRILLTKQTRQVFEDAGVSVGVVSASMPQYEYDECAVQIATMQTVLSRKRKDENYWHDADLVLADEVHQTATGDSADLLNEYKTRGAAVVGVTATPLGVANVCDDLIVAGRTRELQDADILCYALWFAPSELDTRKLVKGKVDLSLTENQARATWGPLKGNDQIRTRIVGNILGHHRDIHPDLTNTLAFAPGVPESLWAAQFYDSKGIRSLHIDSETFWCDGNAYRRVKENESLLESFMQEWRDGLIPIVWNRYLLREGIDEPNIRHLILATPIGSYRSFLQVVGRALRRSALTPRTVTVADHGGSWFRHGSVNVNVDWESVFECNDPDIISKNRIAKLRETGEAVGVGCPKCGMIHANLKGPLIRCSHCGHEFGVAKASRPILQADGTLKRVNTPPISKWKIKSEPGDDKRWKALYFNAMKNKGGDVTFNQLYGQFHYRVAVEKGSQQQPAFWLAYHPARDLPLMPKHVNDWHAKVGDVPKSDLF